MIQGIETLFYRNIQRWKYRLLSLSLLIAAAFILHSLYALSLQFSLQEAERSSAVLSLPFDIMVMLEDGQRIVPEEEWPPGPSFDSRGSYFALPMSKEYETASAVTAESSYGSLDLLGLQLPSAYFRADQMTLHGRLMENEGEIVLPQAFLREHSLELGQGIVLTTAPRGIGRRTVQRAFTIVGAYEGLDVAYALCAVNDAEHLRDYIGPNRFLFTWLWSKDRLDEALVYLKRIYPYATFLHPHTPSERSVSLLSQSSGAGQNLLWLVTLFVGIGVLTIAMTTFLKRRQEIASLKTVGLDEKQLTTLLSLEYALAVLAGLTLGCFGIAASRLFFPWLVELNFLTFMRVLSIAALHMLSASIFGVLFPILTARVATVNQLLFARRIPLGKSQYDHMTKPTPELVYRERTRNERIVRLLPFSESPSLLLMKALHDPVKKGEVVATDETLFGFYTLEWLAPCDGTICAIEPNGIVAIRPCNCAEPFYPYSEDLFLTERNRLQRSKVLHHT